MNGNCHKLHRELQGGLKSRPSGAKCSSQPPCYTASPLGSPSPTLSSGREQEIASEEN